MSVRVVSAFGFVLLACGGPAAQSTPSAMGTAAAATTAATAPAMATTAAPAMTSTAAVPAGSSTSTAPATAATSVAPPSGAPFTASGTFRGLAFTVSCTQFTSGVSDKDVAMQTSQGFVLLSCHDPQTHVQVNVTVAAPAVGDIVPKHSSEGSRIAISVPGGEFISTSDGQNQGKISISTWDVAAHRIGGSVTMTWPHDSSGQGGSLQGSFDVSNLASVK